MFERFTAEAREVVVRAQEEARHADEPTIDGAHLLLGIASVDGPGGAVLRASGVDAGRVRRAIREVGDDPLDAAALAALGIDLGRVRESAEAAFGAGALDDRTRDRKRRSGHIPFTRTAKKSLELSLRAAIGRGDRTIDSRHVLLGVLDTGERRTDAVLARLGVDPDDLRRRLDADSDAA